ncbi:MAG: hypothetical protein IJ272_02550 [Clostridia bacterium]|nr:hypothetical protein [Clostridia bacterium]
MAKINNSIRNSIVIAILSGVAALVCFILLFSTHFWLEGINGGTISLIIVTAIASFVWYVSLHATMQELIFKSSYKKAHQETKKLTTDFSTVTLPRVSALANLIETKDIICQAKLDENNHIVYRISIEAEYSTEDYTTFANSVIIN